MQPLSPVSRLIHVRDGAATACRRWMCEDVTTSANPSEVTCARCRKAIQEDE